MAKGIGAPANVEGAIDLGHYAGTYGGYTVEETTNPTLRDRFTCWWFGCSPVHCDEEVYGYGVMPCERCGASDTTYEDRIGWTLHARLGDWLRRLRWHLFDRWRPHPCQACGKPLGKCASDCDGIPF